MKEYKQPPLPFPGNKRYFLKKFKAALQQIPGAGEGRCIVDVFGGAY